MTTRIRNVLAALMVILLMVTSASAAAEKQGRHFPFTAEQNTDGARYVWWAIGKGLEPYRYVPVGLIPECGDFAPSPNGKPQTADLAWWPGFVALYAGDNAPKESNLFTGRGAMSLKILQKKFGPVKWYRYLVRPPLSEPPKEELVTIDNALDTLGLVLSAYPPKVKSEEKLAAARSNWGKAEREFLLVLQNYPRSVEIERRLGELYRFAHNMDMKDAWTKSEAHYQRAIELSPWSVPSLIGLGLLYVNTDFKNAAKAEPLFEEAIMVSHEGEPPVDAYSGLFFHITIKDVLRPR